MPVQIAGRNTYISTGSLSQTVNVCQTDNRRGKYEWIVRLSQPYFVKEDDIREMTDIKRLIKWLTGERSGKIEKRPSNDEPEIQASVIEPSVEPKNDTMSSKLKPYEYILTKQIQWASNRGILLIGSKGQRGRPAYTPELNQNLFEPLEGG
jgi:hypothetical protein